MAGRVLLHVCCGPCSITPAQALMDEGFEVTGLFVNPNIHPLTEYVRRRDGALEVAERLGFRLIVRDAEYDPGAWLRRVAFREDNRCFHCYSLRLERAFNVARTGGFDLVTSTLLYSKLQKHELIAGLGRDLAAGRDKNDKGPDFLYRDFRQGWQQGIETSKAWGIYRQQYCGCLYSEYERFQKELNP